MEQDRDEDHSTTPHMGLENDTERFVLLKFRQKGYEFLLVPQGTGRHWKLTITEQALDWFAIVAILLVIAAVVLYAPVKQAAERLPELQAENMRLRAENAKVDSLAAQLERTKEFAGRLAELYLSSDNSAK